MTDTTSLGFIYPEDTDYDTGADVPRAVQEAVESIDNFLQDPAELIAIFQAGETLGTFSDLGFANNWTDGGTPSSFRLDVFGRLHLEGQIRSGDLDLTVVSFPAGMRGEITQRWVVPYADSDVAIVEFNGTDLKVVDAPADPATESIALDGISWRATA